MKLEERNCAKVLPASCWQSLQSAAKFSISVRYRQGRAANRGTEDHIERCTLGTNRGVFARGQSWKYSTRGRNNCDRTRWQHRGRGRRIRAGGTNPEEHRVRAAEGWS